MLLNIDSNAKTVKGQSIGYMTGVLYLAPFDLSGYNVCPMALLARCNEPCLNTAGRGAMNNVQLARINKTRKFFADREKFMLELEADIHKLTRKAMRAGLTPLVRLNGTSDIQWELIRYGATQHTLFEKFPDVQFYDYTKIAKRFTRELPANYDLTFSYSGAPEYLEQVHIALQHAARIAVVFRSIHTIPQTFLGLPVVHGDNSDVRHIEPRKTVVALYAKGRAKRDSSGFVQDAHAPYLPASCGH